MASDPTAPDASAGEAALARTEAGRLFAAGRLAEAASAYDRAAALYERAGNRFASGTMARQAARVREAGANAAEPVPQQPAPALGRADSTAADSRPLRAQPALPVPRIARSAGSSSPRPRRPVTLWPSALLGLALLVAIAAVAAGLVATVRYVGDLGPTGPGSAIALDRVTLDETSLPGWVAVQSQSVPGPTESDSLLTRYTGGRTTVGLYQRYLALYPGPASLTIDTTEWIGARYATGSLGHQAGDRTTGDLLAPDGVYRQGTNGGRPVTEVRFSKGRLSFTMTLVGTGEATQAAIDALVGQAIPLANTQYDAAPSLPDLPGGDRALSARPLQMLLWLTEMALLGGLLLVAYAWGWFSDRGCRQTLVSRFRNLGRARPRESTPSPPVAVIDCAPESRAHALRTTVLDGGTALGVLAVWTAFFFLGAVLFGATDNLSATAAGWAALIVTGLGTVSVLVRHWRSSWFPARASTGLAAFLGWAALAYVLLAAAAVLTALGAMSLQSPAVKGSALPAPVGFVAGLIVAAVLAALPLGIARRRVARNLRELNAVDADARPAIVLLRSPGADQVHLRVHAWSGLPLLGWLALTGRARFEEWLGWRLWQHGPVLAIPQPGAEDSRALSMARRTYGAMSWPIGLRPHVANAPLVVCEVGRTGLVEIVRALAPCGALARTVFVVPPGGRRRQAERLGALWAALGRDPAGALGAIPPDRVVLGVCVGGDGVPQVLVDEGMTDQAYAAMLSRVFAGIAGLDAPVSPPEPGPMPDAKPDRRARSGRWQELAVPSLAVTAVIAVVAGVLGAAAWAGLPPTTGETARLPLATQVGLTSLVTAGDGSVYGVTTGANPMLARLTPQSLELLASLPWSASLAVSGDTVVAVHLADGQMQALRVDRGVATVLWSSRLDVPSYVHSPTIIGDRLLLAETPRDCLRVVSMSDGSVTQTVDLGAAPWDIAAWGDKAVVSLPQADRLALIDPAAPNAPSWIPGVSAGTALRVEGDAAWLLSISHETLTRIDLLSGVRSAVSVPGPGMSLAVHGDRAVVAATGQGSGRIPTGVMVVDMATGAVSSVTTPGAVSYLAVLSGHVVGVVSGSPGVTALATLPGAGPVGWPVGAPTSAPPPLPGATGTTGSGPSTASPPASPAAPATPSLPGVTPGQVVPDWQPVGDGWVLSSDEDYSLGPQGNARCEMTMKRKQWTNAASGDLLTVGVLACPSANMTVAAANSFFQGLGSSAQPGYALSSGTGHLWVGSGSGAPAGSLVMRVWAQGTQMIVVSLAGASQEEAVATSQLQADDYAAHAPGTPADTNTVFREFTNAAVSNPLSYYLMMWVSIFFLTHAVRRRGSLSGPCSVPLQPVDKDVQRALWKRRARWLINGFGVTSLLGMGVQLGIAVHAAVLGGSWSWHQWAGLAVGVGCVVALGWRRIGWPLPVTLALAVLLAVVGGAGSGAAATFGSLMPLPLLAAATFARRWASATPAERARGLPGSWSARGVLGLAIRIVAQAVFAAAVCGYLLATFVGAVVDTTVASRLTLGWSVLRAFAATPPTLLFGGVIGVTAVCFFVDRFGQRLQTQSLVEAQRHEQARGHYLWLRSFDEDTAKIQARMMAGGPLGALVPVRRVAFEELMAKQLARVAPVVAVSPPGTVLPPAGAARITLSKAASAGTDVSGDTAWHREVEKAASTARAVVYSASPQRIGEGFSWELATASAMAGGKILIVLGPHDHLAQRWAGFQQAIAGVEILAPIATATLPEGVHVLARNAAGAWCAFGAEERTDWTYAFSFEGALTWLEGAAPGSGVAPVWQRLWGRLRASARAAEASDDHAGGSGVINPDGTVRRPGQPVGQSVLPSTGRQAERSPTDDRVGPFAPTA